jgi:hypothetical protein
MSYRISYVEGRMVHTSTRALEYRGALAICAAVSLCPCLPSSLQRKTALRLRGQPVTEDLDYGNDNIRVDGVENAASR